MSLLVALRHRLRTLLRPGAHARELREEIDFHLSLDAMQQSGHDPLLQSEAPYAARRRFGNITRYTEETREMSGLGFLDMLRQDARFALRTFAQAPMFTAVAVTTIALGIGATAAIFSVVDGLILKPLPYPEADRLVQVWMDNRQLKLAEDVHSIPNLMDLRAQNQTLSHLAPYRSTGANLTGAGEPQRIPVGLMAAEALAALGTRPQLGQLYGADAERAGNDAVVVISHQLWQTSLGGDPAVVGRELELNMRKRRIIGVMPPSFAFPSPETQAWLPLVLSDAARNARGSFGYWAIGKLKPGVSVERARADLGAIAVRLAEQYPRINSEYGVTVTPLPEQIVGPTLRTTLWLMLAAVAAVLLIACANVANLLLSRAAVREREVTVRMALGASNRRLVRQMMTESLILSAIGGVVGVALALAALRALPALAPQDLPRLSNVQLNGTVLLVTTAVTVITGLLFGLVPAVQSSRTQLSETLREGGRGGTSGRGGQRLRRVIVGAQLALVVVLLTGAGLLLRTFIGLQRTELGFETKNVLTMRITLPTAKYSQAPQIAAFYAGLLTRLRQIPGVQNAGTVSNMMLTTLPTSASMMAEGRETRQDDQAVPYDAVSTGFFATIGARIVAGRDFGPQDQTGSLLAGIVNEHMARRYWPDGNVIGRRIRFGSSTEPRADSAQNPWITVVGVVADMRRTGVDMPVRDELFFPYAQYVTPGALVVIRTAVDPMTMVPRFRQAVGELDRDQPIASIRTMDQILSGLIAQRRFSMTLVAGFAVLALLLAVIGAYGVTSYLVSQRTREIGVRLALGADPSRISRLVVREGMVVAGAGVAVGVIGAVATTRLASSLLYGVSARDPITIVSVAATLLAVSALANYIPARKASRVDPLLALRQD
jgi:predicted permease